MQLDVYKAINLREKRHLFINVRKECGLQYRPKWMEHGHDAFWTSKLTFHLSGINNLTFQKIM